MLLSRSSSLLFSVIFFITPIHTIFWKQWPQSNAMFWNLENREGKTTHNTTSPPLVTCMQGKVWPDGDAISFMFLISFLTFFISFSSFLPNSIFMHPPMPQTFWKWGENNNSMQDLQCCNRCIPEKRYNKKVLHKLLQSDAYFWGPCTLFLFLFHFDCRFSKFYYQCCHIHTPWRRFTPI